MGDRTTLSLGVAVGIVTGEVVGRRLAHLVGVLAAAVSGGSR